MNTQENDMNAKTLATSLIGLLLAAAANAQSAPIEFRVVAAKGNPAGCSRAIQA